MKTINRINLFPFVVILAFGVQSCMDLEEETFNILEANVYYKDQASIEAIIGNLYTSNEDQRSTLHMLQEFTADQIQWRTWNGGSYGWDGGEKYLLSIQNWTPQNPLIQEAWRNGFLTIGYCNSALDDFSKLNLENIGITSKELAAYVAEVRTLRAWIYYKMFELYGGVLPIATTIDPSILPPSASPDFNEGCKLIYNFIMEELEESLNDLPKNINNRMNQAVNRILKAYLLLNAQIFVGEDHFSECATLCQQLLDGDFGNYMLASNYQNIFAYNNNTCPEIIFATSFKHGYFTVVDRTRPFLLKSLTPYFGAILPLDFQHGSSCIIISPSKDNSGNLIKNEPVKSFLFDYGDKLGAVVDRMHDNDIRKQNYYYDVGTNESYGMLLNGAMYENFGTGKPIKGFADRMGQNLVIVDQVGTFQNIGKNLEVVMTPRWGEINSGINLVINVSHLIYFAV